jgi:superfamily II DNA/RNA helicase
MTEFEKLDNHFENTLSSGGINPPNTLQEAVIKRVKQGGDLIVVAPKGSGKTYSSILTSLLKCPESNEGSPRVLYIGSDDAEIVELTKKVAHLSRRKELMIEGANDKGKIVQQRNFIFQGADIIFGSPKRIYNLYIQSGLNLNKLNLVILDNPDLFLNDKLMGEIIRVAEGLPKCQRIFLVEEITPKVERIASYFLNHPLIIED